MSKQRICTIFSLLSAISVLVACPTPSAVPGDGDGRTDVNDEGNDIPDLPPAEEVDGTVAETGELIIEGEGLRLEDVSKDGTELAYRDDNDTLLTVAPGGGASSQVAVNTEKARYHGSSLVLLAGDVDGTGSIFASAHRRRAGDAPTPLGTNVKMNSIEASPDGEHIYFEQAIGDSLEDLYLDGQLLLAGASKEKVRFSPDYLVVGANFPDPEGGSIKLVHAYPLGGGARVVHQTDGATNETQVTRDGSRLIFGADEDANIVDIMIAPIEGGPATLLKEGGDDASFKVTHANDEVIYLTNTLTTGGIEAVAFDGSGRRTILASGAVDLIDISSTHIVYASAVDPTTELPTLRIVGLDGEGDAPLSEGAAVEEGFTEDERFFLWRDGLSGDFGSLRAFDVDTGTTLTVSGNVKKASMAAGSTVVFTTSSFNLAIAALPDDARIISNDVSDFNVVPPALDVAPDRVAYEKEDGIYLRDLE